MFKKKVEETMNQTETTTLNPTLDVNAFLKSASTSPASTGAMDEINDAELVPVIDQYLEKRKKLEDLEVEVQLAASQLVSRSKSWYELNKGKLSSVKFLGTTGKVMSTFTNRFSKLSNDTSEKIKSLLGIRFNTYFEEKRIITLNKTDDDTIKMLINAVGKEKFVEIFKIQIEATPKKDLNEKQFELPQDVRDLISQYSPGMKVM